MIELAEILKFFVESSRIGRNLCVVYDRAFRPGPGPGRALGFWAKPGPGRAYQKPGPGTGPEKSLNFPGEMVKISKFFNEFLKLEFKAYNLNEEINN